jgi:Na+/proline symporter
MSNLVSGLPHPVEDFAVRAASYHHFMLGVKWVAITLGALLAFLVVSFCTPAGMFAGLVTGVVVYVIGAWAMKAFLAHSTEAEMGYPPHR